MNAKFLLLPALILIPCDAQAQNAPARKAVAQIAGQTVYEDDLAPLVERDLRPLRTQEYEIKLRAVERLILQKLLDAEAQKKSATIDELLEKEVNSRVAEPTESEAEAFYLGQREKVNRPFSEVRAQMASALKRLRVQQAQQAYIQALRQRAEVAILLLPPKVDVAFDPARLLGKPDAPIVIIQFSDFECPSCRRVYPTLKDVLAKYEGRVSFAYRDFPLRDIHPQAQAAAEAARCALEQGKFWEYHDALFTGKLDRESLVETSRKLNLDERKFVTCLDNGKYRAQVEQDFQDGLRAGVAGTPAFFVNGIFLSGAQSAAAFEKIIEAELTAAGASPPHPSHKPAPKQKGPT